MTASRVMLSLGMLVAVIGGCARDGEGAPADGPGEPCELVGGSPVTQSATLGGIDYRVTGGITGRGDGTSLQIASDGAVIRETYPRGTETGRLDSATLDDLARKLRAAQLPTLCARYPCSGCGDDYVYDVTVQFNGNPYRVEASSLAPPLPDRLQAVIEALHEIVARPLP